MKGRTAWERIAEDPATTKAEALAVVLTAARRCKSFKTTATTPELQTLILAIENYDALESE